MPQNYFARLFTMVKITDGMVIPHELRTFSAGVDVGKPLVYVSGLVANTETTCDTKCGFCLKEFSISDKTISTYDRDGNRYLVVCESCSKLIRDNELLQN